MAVVDGSRVATTSDRAWELSRDTDRRPTAENHQVQSEAKEKKAKF